MKKKEGLWLAIDGIDAVGKSTQVPRVAGDLRDRNVQPVVELKEFSNAPVGQTILRILNEKRFYALNDEKTSPLADTLHLLSDMVYNYETAIYPAVQNGGVAVTDRGASSFVGYQAVRVGERSPQFGERKAISWAQSITRHCLVIPDLTVLIRISHDEMMRRVVQRGEEPLSANELEFLDKVDRTMVKTIKGLSKEHIIIDGQQPIEEITTQIADYVMQRLR